MVADPQHRPLRKFADYLDVEGQGSDQALHEQAGPALAPFDRRLEAQAFAQGDNAGHQHALRQHQQQSDEAGQYPQLRHQTAALKWRA